MNITPENYLAHYGIIRKSGRYPWGSGGNKTTLSGSFLDVVAGLKAKGYTDTEIAKGFGIKTTQLRAAKSIESNRLRENKIREAQKLKDKGYGNSAIAKRMGINESSVRSLLAPGDIDKKETIQTIASVLKKEVQDKTYIDVGVGVENRLGISGTKLKTAVEVLREEGYVLVNVQQPQLSGSNMTTFKVLAPPGSTYREVKENAGLIRQIGPHSDDHGRNFELIKPPKSISLDRVQVKYAEEGGSLADGVIYVRRGVKDTDLGGGTYAQVRIAVNGTHYLKGMAIYKDDLPAGVDLQFNTNKSSTGNKLDAMKKMKVDADGNIDKLSPFGSQIRRQILDEKQEKPTSVMNILDEEGTWGNWSKSISTQVLSKQPPSLAKEQLDLTFAKKRADLDELKALTNPTVRKKLLELYADGADSSAVHLKAAHLPRQATHVILPVPSLKENQVYAPKYRNGEVLALVRYPHGGKFEIPELVVNNNHAPAVKLLGKNAKDAIGINPKVAARLSGADFDGDTVVVIPNNSRKLKTQPALEALKNFDPQRQYKAYDGMKTIDGGVWNATTKSVDYGGKNPSGRAKGTQMGFVSNLITDMTIKGAGPDELARAVKHSMVVIDAEKHSLDYKQSAIDQGIKQLYLKYQDRAQGGSSTLISRATSQKTVDAKTPRAAKDGGPIDPKTGKLVFVKKTYVDRDGVTRTIRTKVDKLADTDDAFTLTSKPGTKIEDVYASHSNRLKALANEARIEVAAFKPPPQNKSAKEAFRPEVASLLDKLDTAIRNKPLERQAQIFANAEVRMKLEANPNMDPSDLKKIKSQALIKARARTEAKKNQITPTPKEWQAIQAGAISQNQLKQILDNADLDAVRELATPRTKLLMTAAKTSRARSMANAGYTQAEIADALGVSESTLTRSIN